MLVNSENLCTKTGFEHADTSIDDLNDGFNMFQSFTVFGKNDDLNVSVMTKAVLKSLLFRMSCMRNI